MKLSITFNLMLFRDATVSIHLSILSIKGANNNSEDAKRCTVYNDNKLI